MRPSRIILKTSPPTPEVKFDLETEIQGRSILSISSDLSEKVLRYYLENPSALKTIDRRRFEELVAELFDGFGFEVELQQQTRDGGKDIIAIKHDVVSSKYLIECKRPDPQNKVAIGPVKILHATVEDEAATKGILVTTSYFTQPARKYFEKHRWLLEPKDLDDLQGWIKDYLR